MEADATRLAQEPDAATLRGRRRGARAGGARSLCRTCGPVGRGGGGAPAPEEPLVAKRLAAVETELLAEEAEQRAMRMEAQAAKEAAKEAARRRRWKRRSLRRRLL